MTLKTIQEYFPKHKTLVGYFQNIPRLCHKINKINEEKECDFFRRLAFYDEIPIVYLEDKTVFHITFGFKTVVGYINFGDEDDFYLALRTDEVGKFEFFNPFNEDCEDIIITSKTRAFEDIIKATKEKFVKIKNIPKENVFTSWEEMRQRLALS